MKIVVDIKAKRNIGNSNPMVFRVVFLVSVWSLLLLASCTKDEGKLFKKMSSYSTGIDFSNDIEESEELNIVEYSYMYNGGGVAAGDINNDGLPDLLFTSNQGADKLYLNQGGLEFKDITEMAGVAGPEGSTSWTTGVTMADVNGDGWLDIYICQVNGFKNLQGKNRLYINNKDNTFTENAGEYGLDIASYSQHATFFDYDKDGDLDMYLLNHSIHSTESYKPSKFREERDDLAGDRIFRNDGDKFVDVSEEAGIFGGTMGYGLAVSTGDINNDGWPDIYVSNDFHENDYLYYNNQDGTFSEKITASTGHVSAFSMGNDISDYNNDGWLDIATMDMKPFDESISKKTSGVDPYDIYQYKRQFGYHHQYGRNMLQANAGPLLGEDLVQFREVGQYQGVEATDWSWSVIFDDLDNNGTKDMFVSNGIPKRPNNLDFTNYTSNDFIKADSISTLQLIELIPRGDIENMAYRNNGEKFEEVGNVWGLDFKGLSNGAITVDLDNDGDLDIVTNNLDDDAGIFENRLMEQQPKSFLKVKLNGNDKNTFGIGARVKIETASGIQIQEVKSTKGWLSSAIVDVHFGLGDDDKIYKTTISWPDDTVEKIKNVAVNTTLKVDQSNAKKSDGSYTTQKASKLFVDVSQDSGIDFIHEENFFVDFSVEQLIPHLISTEGPKIAVGDVNGDGLDDFFIGGAKNQAGSLFLQQKGKETYFEKGNTNVFEKDKFCEDVGASFLDVDGDGDLDLYIASGGGEPDKSVRVRDRLYYNDGKGNFTLMEDAVPGNRFNASCVVSGDFNNDGNPDFFIGGRSTPHEYGNPGISRVLINDGTGKFSDQTSGYLSYNGRIGMVTDAAWLRTSRELVVVGEWMPISIFKYQDDQVFVSSIDNSSGWWNTIEAVDLDGDGDQDFLLGNMGLNTNLSASPEKPIDLYLRDFDGNLAYDPVMAYYRNDKQWVYPGLDMLSKQIVSVKKVYKTYEKYASSTFNEIFPEEQLANSYHLQVQTLASIWLENRGDSTFMMHDLPIEAQLSPIYGFSTQDVDLDGNLDVLAVGNFFGNQPDMGRSDASFGVFLKGKGNGELEYMDNKKSGFSLAGEARDIKIVKSSKDESLILVSRNNTDTRVFKIRGEQQ